MTPVWILFLADVDGEVSIGGIYSEEQRATDAATRVPAPTKFRVEPTWFDVDLFVSIGSVSITPVAG